MGKVLLFAVLAALLQAGCAQDNGCIFIDGVCSDYCPDGTHGYSVGCGTVMTQATCADPVSEPMEGIICDLSRCDCNEPTVLDTRSDKCVLFEDCPYVSEPNPEPCTENNGEETDTGEPYEFDYEKSEHNEENEEEIYEKPDAN